MKSDGGRGARPCEHARCTSASELTARKSHGVNNEITQPRQRCRSTEQLPL
jgi:hypothetical protein